MTSIPAQPSSPADPDPDLTSARPRRFGLPPRHPIYKWLALLATLIALARAALTVGVFNHTTDELSHIAGAVGLYESGRNVYMFEHPPFQRWVVGGALRLAGVEYPPARDVTWVQHRDEANVVGEAIAFHGTVPYWRVLAVGRLANLVFAAVLLAYIYLLGKYLAGPLVGMLATVFFSLDPTLLGHAALITTDVPAAAGFVAATYHALRFVGRPTWTTAGAAGLALGLAMACKFTCVLLAPAILLLIVIRAIRHAKQTHQPSSTGFVPRAWRHLPKLRHFAAIALIAFVALWATYGFHVGKLSEQYHFENETGWQKLPRWVKDTPVPMPAMGLGLMFMSVLAKFGFPSYFKGEISYDSHLGYFPTAIAAKEPVALVAGIGVAIVALLMLRKSRRPILTLCVLLPPSLLFLAAATGRLQIGIRHILPVLPFLYLFVCLQMRRGPWAFGLVGLIAIASAEIGVSHPDYLAFFNRLSGGPARGQEVLADSNIDWGQDVARLAKYLETEQRGRPYAFKVSGARVPALAEFLGLNPKSRIMTAAELANGSTDGVDLRELRKRPRGLLALGVNAKLRLEETKLVDTKPVLGPDFSWVSKYPLIKRIGGSIEVYDLEPETGAPSGR